jgi:hypothetical protein
MTLFQKINIQLVAAILIIIGIVLVIYSTQISPYTDSELFAQKYASINYDTKAFFQLREQMSTYKYPVQDYGGTLIVIGMTLLLITKLKLFMTPQSTWKIVGTTLFVPFLTIAAYIFDILKISHRVEVPWWADSLGIPLAASPILLGILILWSVLHLFFIRHYQADVPLINAMRLKRNYWLLLLAGFAALMVLLMASFGLYWYLISSLIWLYIYLVLASSRATYKTSA